MIVINSSTRQFNIPGADLVFGVEADSGSTVKEFQCPRYVGNHLDLTGCFIRMNYRNANGEIDEYLVKDVTVDGDNVVFGWELTPKVTMYKGNVSFVMCVVGPDTKMKWHTTLGRGQVLEGLEPDNSIIEPETADVVAQLIAMVEAQTDAVKAEGSKQIKAVQTAAQTAQSDAVAQIEAKGVNTRNSIPADYTALSEAVDGLVRGRAGAIVCSAEGSAVVVNDTSDMAIQGMKIFGRSTQDGSPTPDAPVEIKSVVEPVVIVRGAQLFNKDDRLAGHGIGKTSGNVYVDSNTFSTGYICVRGLTSISHNASSDSTGSTWGAWYDNEKNYLCELSVRGTATVPEGACFVRITFANEHLETLMINAGSEIMSYEPYSYQTVELTHTLPGIPVATGGNYTDATGQQWVCDEVDLERGMYVQRCKKVEFDGTNYSFYPGQHTNGQCYIGISSFGPVRNSKVIASHYKSATWSNNNGEVYCSNDVVILTDNRFTSVSKAKECLVENPVTLLYLLETPIETPLSETEIAAYRALHSNYPNTTVLNDAGAHMVVEYAADTKLYIDKKIAALVGGV